MRERELGRTYAMGLPVRPLRDPELTTWGKSCIIPNESAGATDGEQRRWNKRLPPRSGRRFANALHSGFLNRHGSPRCVRRWSPIENFSLTQSGVSA